MRTKHFILVLLPVFVLLSLAPASHSSVFKATMDVYTQQSPGAAAPDLTLQIWITLQDTKGLRGPDAVSWLKPFTLTAPTGQVFNVSVTNWEEFNNGFGLGVHASDFNGGVIPPGTYKVSFTDTANRVWTASDTLPNPVVYLAIPTVTSPADNATVASLTPTLKWTGLGSALYYRLEMSQVGDGYNTLIFPLYLRPHTAKDVYSTSFTIPQGVLKYNAHYVFRIEARDSDKNLNKRSRSIYMHFTTPPAPVT